MIKRFLIIITSVLFFIVIAILALLIFLYYKGPDFALKKATEIAHEEFNTEIKHRSAGFLGQNGFYVYELSIHHPNFKFEVDKLIVSGKIDRVKRKVEIKEILFENTLIELHQNQTEEDIPAKPDTSKTLAIESFLQNPPSEIQIDLIRFKNISAKITQTKSFKNGAKKTIELEFANADVEINPLIKPNYWQQKVMFSTQTKFTLLTTDQNKRLFASLNKLNVQLNLSTQKSKTQHWLYEVSPLEIQTEIKEVALSRPPIHLSLGSSSFTGKFEMAAHNPRLTDIDTLKIDHINWKTIGKINTIIAQGLPTFQYLPREGFNWQFDSQGTIIPAIANPARFNLPWSWDIFWKVNAGPFIFKDAKTSIQSQGHWTDTNGRFEVQSSPRKLFNIRGTGEAQKQQLQFDGIVEMQVPVDLAELILKRSASGEVKAPIHLVVAPGDKNTFELALDTVVEFKQFNFKSESYGFDGLSGQMPITQRLVWDRNKKGLAAFQFKEIFKQNPFERADYERLDPLLRTNDRIHANHLYWENQSFGPMRGIMDLEQNFLSFHGFTLDFVNGSASGEIFIDLLPNQQRVGFLGRLTQIDLRHLVPQKYLGTLNSNEALPFSARTGIVLMVENRTLDGRMDVTQVARPQLLTLLNVLDPLYEDEKLNKIRALMEVGYPTSVNMGFHEGALDLEIDLKALGLSTHQRLNGISIQTILDKVIKTQLKTIEQITQ